MLVNCNSCQKKFNVPDSAITDAGRLLQCGTCGNKWTQYPIKQDSVKKISKTKPAKIIQTPEANKVRNLTKKRKRKVTLYSEEYLKRKHGLEIKNSIDSNKKTEKYKNITSNNNFFSNLIIIAIIVIAFFGILNISKDFIIVNYPFAETYINSIYEVVEILSAVISNLAN